MAWLQQDLASITFDFDWANASSNNLYGQRTDPRLKVVLRDCTRRRGRLEIPEAADVATFLLSDGEPSTRAIVTQSFDPLPYDNSLERVPKSHYFVKDSKPIELGTLKRREDESLPRLQATRLTGHRAITSTPSI